MEKAPERRPLPYPFSSLTTLLFFLSQPFGRGNPVPGHVVALFRPPIVPRSWRELRPGRSRGVSPGCHCWEPSFHSFSFQLSPLFHVWSRAAKSSRKLRLMVCAQETKAAFEGMHSESVNEWWCRQHRWRLTMTRAQIMLSGRASAGGAVFVRSQCGFRIAHGTTVRVARREPEDKHSDRTVNTEVEEEDVTRDTFARV